MQYTGFDGVFCADPKMNLALLILLPAGADQDGPDDLLAHVKREHSAVPYGEFGASCTVFIPWNYGVRAWPAGMRAHTARVRPGTGRSCPHLSALASQIKATPKEEFDFAYLAPDDPALPAATLGTKNGEDLGPRLPRKREIDWRKLADIAILTELLNSCLRNLGLDYTLTEDEVKEIGTSAIELMLCTMYTGSAPTHCHPPTSVPLRSLRPLRAWREGDV